MQKYYLAVDIGASSGRHLLGFVNAEGIFKIEEIHRFTNGMEKKEGKLCWDFGHLFSEIVEGMKKCTHLGKIPVSVGIDTWGVDFVLLDSQDQVIGNTVGYRDSRTEGMDLLVSEMISDKELYERTGIQKQIYNTIYQLMAIQQKNPEDLERTETLLFTPDYFHFLLTGKKTCEYTIATTSQLVSPVTKDWDINLIKRIGLPEHIFLPLSMPKTIVGELKKELVDLLGYNLEIVLPATHDTGSAVLAVPANDNDFLYISSGTWSLMGIETEEANTSEAGRKANFTNEGGLDYRFRYLKNIMGLWMIQSVRHEYKDIYSFETLCNMAEENKEFSSRVDVNDKSFLAPDSMVAAVKKYCQKTCQPVPQSTGEIAAVIYFSLAESYSKTVKEIEEITGRSYKRIHIVGGGSHAEYLNRLTADCTGKEIYAGPAEATAIGNLTAQMLAKGEFSSLKQAREIICKSFEYRQAFPFSSVEN